MIKKLMKLIYVLMCAVLIIQLTGCGTIMYPERKGQKGGKIDIGVALLDAVGLFFFIIPGVIAYAVDFNNGTIYLPGGTSSMDTENIKEVNFDPKNTNMVIIEELVKKETGCDVSLYRDKVKVVALKSSEEMKRCFAENLTTIENKSITLSLK